MLLATAAVVALHVLLALVARELGIFGTLSVWYLPAGLSLTLATVVGWRALPVTAAAEVLVAWLVFGVASDFGPLLLVGNGLAYALIYTAAGRGVRVLGGLATDPDRRSTWEMVALSLGLAPFLAALSGVAFQVLGGVAPAEEYWRDVVIWWGGDAIGIATLSPTLAVLLVRARRGERWWAMPDVGVGVSTATAMAPALVAAMLAFITTDEVVFAAVVFAPYLLVAVNHGLPGVALAAPPTSLAITLVANNALGAEVLARTDVQVLLLALLATGFWAALVVEQRSMLRRRLAAREAHLRVAQAQARAGSFRWDVQSGTVTWTEGMRALLGTTEPLSGPRAYLDRIHPDDRERVDEIMAAAGSGQAEAEHVHRLVGLDDVERTVRIKLSYRRQDDVVVEVVGTATDVTAEMETARRLEQALRREQAATRAEQRATNAVQRAEGVKDALLVAVSHEVRTPLTVVRGLAETLRRPELADAPIASQHAALERLDTNARRLEHVLVDLLDVDRIGRGIVTPVRRPVGLADLVTGVVIGLDGSSRVVVDVPDDLEVTLDARLMARMVEHLVENALRHAPPPSPVVVSGHVDDATLVLRVSDEGPGIPAQEREAVFDAFTRGEVDAASPSTGVGLYLVRRFAELHGGTAQAVGDGDGAVLEVLLPLDHVTLGSRV